jgi:hypothetical protein
MLDILPREVGHNKEKHMSLDWQGFGDLVLQLLGKGKKCAIWSLLS